MNAYLLSLNPEANIADQWDFGFLRDFLVDNNFNIKSVDKIPNGDRAIVVIPGRHHAGLETKVQQELEKLNHAVLFIMGDEEADFDITKIDLPKNRIWVQNPHMGTHDEYNKLGTGYPQHLTKLLPKDLPQKALDVYFAGQITHKRRTELTDVLVEMELTNKNIRTVRTKGFTQGEKPQDYIKNMLSAKVAPAPSGAVIPDSFRLFEALECMAVPIADQKLPNGEVWEYWDWLFNDITPFPKITEWDRLYSLVPEILEDWPNIIHKQTAWYIRYKREFKYKVLEALNG